MYSGQANPDIRNQIGQSALHVALQEGSHMTADVILKNGCDVMISDDLGRSAMFMAIHSPLMKNLETAKSLMAYGKRESMLFVIICLTVL